MDQTRKHKAYQHASRQWRQVLATARFDLRNSNVKCGDVALPRESAAPNTDMIPWIKPGEPLPAAHTARTSPNGLVCASLDLSARRLVEAYSRGLFPWYSDGQPVLWWSPDPRMVLRLAQFRLHRSLIKRLRAVHREQRWRISLDRCFAQVMQACAEPRPGQPGTWITDQIRSAYGELHRLGLAHSVEVWRDQQLIGGLYGVALGRMFFGESMFARETDSSKCALAALVKLLGDQGFEAIDCQQNTAHLDSLGANEIPRTEFLALCTRLIAQPAPDWPALVIDFPNV